MSYLFVSRRVIPNPKIDTLSHEIFHLEDVEDAKLFLK